MGALLFAPHAKPGEGSTKPQVTEVKERQTQ
jgi:hypothetical protein